MPITNISGFSTQLPIPGSASQIFPGGIQGDSFADSLKGFMSDADNMQNQLPLPINNPDGLKTQLPLPDNTQRTFAGGFQGESFTDSLREFISDVNNMQIQSGDLTEKMIKGEPVDIHDVMIAAEKAKTSFQLLLEMRNKFIDLYKEVERISL